MSDEEEWRPVVGYEGLYEVSDQGRVRSLDRVIPIERSDGIAQQRRVAGRIRRPSVNNHGYEMLRLGAHPAPSRLARVHHLVMEAFVGPRKGQWTLHYDDNRRNNKLENLRYGGGSENYVDMVRNGHAPDRKGTRNGRAKLTEVDVDAIRSRVERTNKQFARDFGVSDVMIGLIRRGKNWQVENRAA